MLLFLTVQTTYLKSLTSEQSLAYLLHLRGYLRTLDGNFDEAIADHEKASTFVHKKAISLNFKGDVHVARAGALEQIKPTESVEQEELALELYRKAVVEDVFFTPSYLNRARLFGSRGHFDSAVYECTRALKVNPGYPRALYMRACFYYLSGQYTESLRDFLLLQAMGEDSPYWSEATGYIEKINLLLP